MTLGIESRYAFLSNTRTHTDIFAHVHPRIHGCVLCITCSFHDTRSKWKKEWEEDEEKDEEEEKEMEEELYWRFQFGQSVCTDHHPLMMMIAFIITLGEMT